MRESDVNQYFIVLCRNQAAHDPEHANKGYHSRRAAPVQRALEVAPERFVGLDTAHR